MRLSTIEYKKKKEAFKKSLKISEKEYIRLIKGDYHEGASLASSHDLMAALEGDSSDNVIKPENMDLWDFLWYYKRNFHVVLPQIYGYTYDTNGVDCSILEDLEKDLEIDTILPSQLGDGVAYIRYVKRNVPIVFSSSSCNATIQISLDDGGLLRFHFEISNCVRKVFVETMRYCFKCDKCKRIKSLHGEEFVLRPRFREACGVEMGFSNIMGILHTVIKVAELYQKREKISRQRKVTPDSELTRKIMVARYDEDTDTERVIPMFDYIKEYHESIKQEWKGGHHASPVSHPRSGYYRKCKHGTHILKDGEFIEVGRGLGRFIYVKPTIVNAGKNSVRADMAEVM